MLPAWENGQSDGKVGVSAAPAAKMTIRARFVPVDVCSVNTPGQSGHSFGL